MYTVRNCMKTEKIMYKNLLEEEVSIMTTLFSIRPNGQLVYLLNKLQDYHRGATRTEIINRALEGGKDKRIKWREVAEGKIESVKDISDQPQFIRFRAVTEAVKEVEKNIKIEFDLKIVQKPFLIKLALINYLSDIGLDSDNQRFIREIKGDVWARDPDDTELSKDFYKKFWGDIMDVDIGIYSGDTIISFNTIAGGMIRLLKVYRDGLKIPDTSQGRLEVIKNSIEVPYSLKEDFSTFQEKYHSLANFMPLLKLEDLNYNLNHVKNRDYHDFPDGFLKDIKNFYLNNKGNRVFHEENNKKYLNSFGKAEEGYKNYIEKNYLHDYFLDKNYREVKIISPTSEINFPYNKTIAEKLNYDERERVLLYIGAFLKNALDIIEARGDRLGKIHL